MGEVLGPLLRVSQTKSRSVRGNVILSKTLIFSQAHPGCWQNSVPCGCRIDAPQSDRAPVSLTSFSGSPDYGRATQEQFPLD